MKMYAVAVFSHHTGSITQFMSYNASELEVLKVLYLKEFGTPAPDEDTENAIYEAFYDTDQVVSIMEV